MENKNFPLYFAILFIGLAISFFSIKSGFSVQGIGLLVFLLIFIPTLINPEIGLIIIIISIIYSTAVVAGTTRARAVTVRIEDVILLIILFAWFLRMSLTKDIVNTFRTKITAPFFLYILICLASTLFAAAFGELDIKQSFFSILKYLEYFLLFIMVKDNLNSMRQIKLFVGIFLFVALLTAIHSNMYIAQELERGTNFFRVSGPVETNPGGEPGTIGGYLVFMMAIAGGLLLYTRSLPFKIFLICLELAMFRAFLYTLSRGSYLALIPAVIALAYFTKHGKTILMYTIFVGSILLVLFMPQMVRERITTTVTMKADADGYHTVLEESPQERVDSWKVVMFERVPQSPLIGHGVAKFFIDGQVFTTLCEVGFLGLALFVIIISRLFKEVRRVMDAVSLSGDQFSKGLAVGFLAGFVGLLAHSFSTNTFIVIKIMEPFWFLAAIVLSLPILIEEKEEVLEYR